MKGPSAMLWNYDVSDKEEAERMASLYGEDGTRVVEPGTETETGRNLVRRCGNELGIATWEAYDFDPDTWTCRSLLCSGGRTPGHLLGQVCRAE